MDERTYINICKALSDSNRMRIFKMLKGREMCANEILEHLKCSQPTLSYHMKLLCGSGLVNADKQGLWMHYSINDKTLREFTDYFRYMQEAEK